MFSFFRVFAVIVLLGAAPTLGAAQPDAPKGTDTPTDSEEGLLKNRFNTGSARSDRDLSPVEFYKKPAYRLFSISPNGRYLAIVEDIPFEEAYKHSLDKPEQENSKKRGPTIDLTSHVYGEQILIYDFDSNAVIQTLRFYERELYWTQWANNDRLLASVSTNYKLKFGRIATFELPAARTLSIDWRTQDGVVLFENDRALQRENLTLSSVVDPLPADGNHVMMSAYKNGDLDLWRVNVLTGDAEREGIGGNGTFAWITDHAGNPVFRLDQNRSGSVMRVFTQNERGRWEKIITTPLNGSGGSSIFQPIAKGREPGEIYVLATPDGEDKAVIKAFNIKTGALTRTVAAANGYDIGGGLIEPETGIYRGAWYLDDRRRLILENAELQRHVNGIAAFFGHDANIRLLAASREYSKLIILVTSPTISGEVFAYDYANTRLDPLFASYPKLSEERLSPVEILRYPTRDGNWINSYLTHPRKVGDTGLAPLVIMPHGGPAVRDYYDFDPGAQFLASRGYRVFQPNFRGSSGYGAAFLEAGFHEWGGKMHDDLMDGVAYLVDRGLARPGNICIVGASYGGYAALYASMVEPEIFSCAVSISGVSDLPGLLDHERKDRTNSKEDFQFIVKQIGDPKADRAMLEARSPKRHPEKLTVPLLLVHGRYDQVVPYAQFTDLTSALNEAEVKYEWLVLNDGHNLAALTSKVQSMKKVDRFLNKHLHP